MDKEGDTFSVRSTTELMNLLVKLKVGFEEREYSILLPKDCASWN
jgi:hypothetical protein